MRQGSGFSLLEAIVAMLVLGLIFSLAVPSTATLLDHWRVLAASRALHHDLQHARQLAQLRQQRLLMCPSLDGHGCSDQAAWHDGWLIKVEGGAILHHGPAQRPVQIHSGGRQQVRFLANGNAAGSNLSFHLQAGQPARAQRRVVVSNTGRSRIEVIPPALH